ncbi:PEGA domain-containing protein [Vibrio tapetis subsp. quintayensis]|uniref:PEGA domain-containing protein n=1 Tax=Vibrio tapetis TaxID=52443 RepID=UPI0025B559F3|nr:PEGA domain-containing protein [Vibrio tapetis]MDN3682825.1 PEGA domain-containing protein [Vibrio tapetis subsp. quintayensis]
MKQVIFIILGSLMFASAASGSDLKAKVLDVVQEEALGAVTGESLNWLDSLGDNMKENEFSNQKPQDPVRVFFSQQGSYKVGVSQGGKAIYVFPQLNSVVVPRSAKFLVFYQDGKLVNYRKLTIPKNALAIKETAQPIFSKGRKIPIRIQTYPSDAVVKIMNIGPKYSDNILLTKGKYDVLVKSKGYKTYRKMVFFDKYSPVHHVKLQKR